jgi:hypothetical protein
VKQKRRCSCCCCRSSHLCAQVLNGFLLYNLSQRGAATAAASLLCWSTAAGAIAGSSRCTVQCAGSRRTMQHFKLILLLHAACASLAAGFAHPTSTAFTGFAHASSPAAQCSRSSSSAGVLGSFGVQRSSAGSTSSSSKRGRAAASRAAAYNARQEDVSGSSSVPAPYYPPTNFDRLQSMLLSENAKKLGVWAAFFLLVSRLKSFYGEF